jgi:eukaryotic-like serine/threonine-protein kinase
MDSGSVPVAKAERFPNNSNYLHVRRLGEGGMGIVFEARRKPGVSAESTKLPSNPSIEEANLARLADTGHVALKTLPLLRADALLSLKDEFRRFQHISHPNVVSLFDLHCEGRDWFLTMELVKGSDFLTFVRTHDPERSAIALDPTVAFEGAEPSPSPPPASVIQHAGTANEIRLRSSLLQLATALRHVHQAGLVHRDVKPSNVLTELDGRVVLLDFGIGVRADGKEEDGAAGTPAYMPPEVLRGATPSQAGDWYAVGVMLYQALTGRDPFSGDFNALYAQKFSPLEIPEDSRLPPDLVALCNSLLRIDARARAKFEDIARIIDPTVTRLPRRALDEPAPLFVGRANELVALENELRVAESGNGVHVVYLLGESGVGKSALVEEFLSRRSRNNKYIVLEGRCFEAEQVPYKGFDGVIDALARHLGRLRSGAHLQPKYIEYLLHAFPTLRTARIYQRVGLPRRDIDPQEARRRVFDALRSLLRMVSKDHTLIIWIDDAHWSDPDTGVLLRHVFGDAEDSPKALFLCCVRSDRNGSVLPSNLSMMSLMPSGRSDGGTTLWEEPLPGKKIQLARLKPEDARNLTTLSAIEYDLRDDDALVDALLQEAQGHPLFLIELARSAQLFGPLVRPTLSDAILSRLSLVGEEAASLALYVALSPGPLHVQLLYRLAKVDYVVARKSEKELRARRIIRSTRGASRPYHVEPYHRLVREALLASISEAGRAALHHNLAEAHLQEETIDYQAVAHHLYEAGEVARAAEYAWQGGVSYAQVQAFDQAAELFGLALTLVPDVGDLSRTLKYAETLRDAGHGKRAAEQFLHCAAHAKTEVSGSLQCEAAGLLLRSGHIDEGTKVLQRVLESCDLSFPRSGFEAAMSWQWSRSVLRYPVLPKFVSNASRLQLQVCWDAALGLSLVDQIRGFSFHGLHARLALRLREKADIARALAMDGPITVGIDGEAGLADAMAQIQRAESMMTSEDHVGKALVMTTRAMSLFVANRWHEAIAQANAALELARERCRGFTWAIATNTQVLAWSLGFSGQLDELRTVARRGAREALQRDDRFGLVPCWAGPASWLALVADNPELALRQANDAIASWSQIGFHVQHMSVLVSKVAIYLYRNQIEAAKRELSIALPRINEAQQLRVEFNRFLWHGLTTRACLARLAENSLDRAARKELLDSIKVLTRGTTASSRGEGALARAQLLYLDGENEEAIVCANEAKRSFDEAGMLLHLAVSEALEKAFRSPTTANDEIHTAGDYFGVKKPIAFFAVFAPITRAFDPKPKG